ncbi:hypothetical protein C4588_08025 [Candidatus Parcubacteria bacterium]|nr:MAG: hypothetical protein C4588_08025 [Candidatus Parcubacteria bacterium]
MRIYRYLVRSRVALAVDCQDGQARVAVTLCNPVDPYSRPAAQTILNLMFDATPETLRVLNLRRYVYSFPYEGDKPVRDILKPLTTAMESILAMRMRAYDENCMDLEACASRDLLPSRILRVAEKFAKDRRPKYQLEDKNTFINSLFKPEEAAGKV